MITYNKSTFSANDSRQKVWTLDGHGILHPKEKRKRIMVLDFLLPWSRLNLFSLPLEQQKHLADSNNLLKTMTYFKYGKTEEGYWTGEYLLDQITKKALPIAQELYLRYELLFMFDNTMSHLIYAKNALQFAYMNKEPGGQQSFLWPG